MISRKCLCCQAEGDEYMSASRPLMQDTRYLTWLSGSVFFFCCDVSSLTCPDSDPWLPSLWCYNSIVKWTGYLFQNTKSTKTLDTWESFRTTVLLGNDFSSTLNTSSDAHHSFLLPRPYEYFTVCCMKRWQIYKEIIFYEFWMKMIEEYVRGEFCALTQIKNRDGCQLWDCGHNVFSTLSASTIMLPQPFNLIIKTHIFIAPMMLL